MYIIGGMGSYEHDFSQIGGLGAVGTQTLGVDGIEFLNDSGFRIRG